MGALVVAGLDRLLTPEGWPLASAPLGRFAALFGRDSLITSLQLLPARPDVARATLRALARLQGGRDEPESEEQPGRIVHEHWRRAPERLHELGWTEPGHEFRYYGSADATAWFLLVLGCLDDRELSAELEPSWRAAGNWLERALEGGGGLLRSGPGRLVQQGWRDTANPLDPRTGGAGILRRDGSAPKPPLADADTQAVAAAALHALAGLSGEDRHADLAEEMAERLEERFGPETMAIEAGDREVEGAGSQLGWLLWSGALSDEAAGRLAERLVQPDVLTDWGLRTLSSAHPAFEAQAYHRGAVWPFDSWLGWGGLRSAGAEDDAERLRVGVLEAIERLGRWPELYAVGPDGPQDIPVANPVQAWTVGAAWALEKQWDGRITALAGRVTTG